LTDHMLGDIARLVAEHGLSVVLLFIVGYAYDKQQKKHEEERKQWDAERERLYLASKADAEKLSATLLRMHEHSAKIIDQANDIASTLEQEKKEIRESRERELREMGPRMPPRVR
jgi:DNA anti-recombination protein RmuC